MLQRLITDLAAALKAGERAKVDAIRLIVAAFKNAEIDKRSSSRGVPAALSDDEAFRVLAREAKKRKDAIEIYRTNNRGDLAAKEEAELAVIVSYLPPEPDEEELLCVVREAVAEARAQAGGTLGAADFGKVIGVVMKRIKSASVGARVQALVRRELG